LATEDVGFDLESSVVKYQLDMVCGVCVENDGYEVNIAENAR
jgi:hypothetical protein